MREYASTWAVTCPGYARSAEPEVARDLRPVDQMVHHQSVQPGGAGRWLGGDLQVKANLMRPRHVQQTQGKQGWSVFDGTVLIALTAHEGATKQGGVSGPYPWRQPV